MGYRGGLGNNAESHWEGSEQTFLNDSKHDRSQGGGRGYLTTHAQLLQSFSFKCEEGNVVYSDRIKTRCASECS